MEIKTDKAVRKIQEMKPLEIREALFKGIAEQSANQVKTLLFNVSIQKESGKTDLYRIDEDGSATFKALDFDREADPYLHSIMEYVDMMSRTSDVTKVRKSNDAAVKAVAYSFRH